MFHLARSNRKAKLDSSFVNVVLPLANAIVMFGIGLTLRPFDFKLVALHPRAIACGIIGSYLLLPVIGFAVASLCADDYRHAIGFMLIAACPSANVSNLFTYLARGNVALAVMLTAISAVVTLASIPLAISFATWWFADQATVIHLSLARTVAFLFALVALPILVGMATRRLAPSLSRHMEAWVARLSLAFLLLTIAIIVLENLDVVASSILELGTAAVTMCSLGIVLGMAMARAAKLPGPDVVAIGIEVGIQNCMLAFFVAIGILGEPRIAIPAVVYGTLMFLPAFATVALTRARIKCWLQRRQDNSFRKM